MISQAASAANKVPPPAPARVDNVLVTDELVKVYGGRSVVNGININVKAGEVVGLLGPNGAGKTTSFYMIVGLVRPDSGRVLFRDRDVTNFPMYKRARLGMGYLSQEPSIFQRLTCEQNLLAILETTSIARSERKKKAAELLERFSLTHKAKQLARTCSA